MPLSLSWNLADDPRQPLAVRVAALEELWASFNSEPEVRRKIARTAADFFTAGERPLLPVDLRRQLAISLLANLSLNEDRHGNIFVLLVWLSSFSATEQLELWSVEALIQLWENDSERDILIETLASPDAGLSLAARNGLLKAALSCPGILIKFLDQAFLWLQPDFIEPLAADLTDQVSQPELFGEAARTVRSARLRRLVVPSSKFQVPS